VDAVVDAVEFDGEVGGQKAHQGTVPGPKGDGGEQILLIGDHRPSSVSIPAGDGRPSGVPQWLHLWLHSPAIGKTQG
jgi:hypothetical protein